MPDFNRKKHIVLAIIFLATAIVLALLIGWDVYQFVRIQKSMSEIDACDKAIQDINDTGEEAPPEFKPDPNWNAEEKEAAFQKWDARRQNPRIVKKNAELIENDARELAGQTRKIQRVYGQVYDNAFETFLANLLIPAASRPLQTSAASAPSVREAPDVSPAVSAMGKDVAGVGKTATSSPAAPGKPVQSVSGVSSPEGLETERIVIKEMEKWSFEGLRRKFRALIRQKARNGKPRYRLKDVSVLDRENLFNTFRNELLKEPAGLPDDLAESYKKIAAEHFDYAFSLFRKDIQKMTVEDALDPKSEAARAAFLQALGLPRTMTRTEFITYSASFREKILASESVPLISMDKSAEIRSFMLFVGKKDPDTIPPVDNIPQIIRRFQIFEDLFARIKAAGIIALLDIRQAEGCDDLLGRRSRNGDYHTYSYTVKLRGSLPQIRKFFNLLHQAYRDNRVYIVTSLSLKTFSFAQKGMDASSDEVTVAQKMVSEAKHKSAQRLHQKTEKEAPATASPLRPDSSASKPSAGEKVKPSDETEDPNYGVTLLGNNDQLLVTFTFDYVIYVGDSIHKKTAH